MARKDPAPFAPKPFKPGSVVTVDGVDYRVWSVGPLPASVWAQDEAGAFTAIKNPTPSRPAYVLPAETLRTLRREHERRLARAACAAA